MNAEHQIWPRASAGIEWGEWGGEKERRMSWGRGTEGKYRKVAFKSFYLPLFKPYINYICELFYLCTLHNIERFKILWCLESELGVRCLAHLFFLLLSLEPLWDLFPDEENGRVILPHKQTLISSYSNLSYVPDAFFQKHSLYHTARLFYNTEWPSWPPGLSPCSPAC